MGDSQAYQPEDTHTSENHNESETNEAPEEKYWKLVRENPSDFTSWTSLLQSVEKQTDIQKIRQAYDQFLAEFPLCYVYWKKFADHELAQNEEKRAMEIYERGLTYGIPHSVELWAHYCSQIAERSEDLDEIRSLFERAVSVVGTDFAAHALWDKYLEFELSQHEFKRVNSLYLRILAIPLDQLSQYFEKYKTFTNPRPYADLLVDTDNANEFKLGPGETEADVVKRIIAKREMLYKTTLEDVTKRRAFEVGVQKRPYFHVKPLDESQLVNWRKYLEFEESEKNQERAIKLYERCLIPCSNYPEFWLRYVSYLESIGRIDGARNILIRAKDIFFKRKPEIHIQYALFEEAHNNEAGASEVLHNLLLSNPAHLETALRTAAFHARLYRKKQDPNELVTAKKIYKQIIDGREGKEFVFLSTNYSRFLSFHGFWDEAASVLNSALSKSSDRQLWLALIDLTQHRYKGQEEVSQVNAIFERILGSHDGKSLSEEDKSYFISLHLEYLADFGTDAVHLRNLELKYIKNLGFSKTESRKRALFQISNSPFSSDDRNGTGIMGAGPSKIARVGSAQSVSSGAPSSPYSSAATAAAHYAGSAGYPGTSYSTGYAGAASSAYGTYPGYTYPQQSYSGYSGYGYGSYTGY